MSVANDGHVDQVQGTGKKILDSNLSSRGNSEYSI